MSGHLLWERLERALRAEVDHFAGVAGISLRDLESGHTLSIHADELFPTASTIKIHVLVQLLLRAERGEIDLTERITMPLAEPVYGSGVLAYLPGPVELSLLDVATLMIIASDNTATNFCIERAGMQETNGLLRSLGLHATHLRRKMMDHIAAVREQENVSTPAELVQMLTLLHTDQPTPGVAQQVLEILKKPNLGFLERGLPAGIEIANKPGWVEAARCDAGIIYLPRRPYALAVMTKYTLCDTLTHENFIGRVAQLVHESMSILARSNRYGRTVY